LKAHRAADKFRGWTGVQTEFIDNLHFSPHLSGNIESAGSSFE
jgi:hypothetical protein